MSEFLVSLNPLNLEPVGQVPITSRSELADIVGRSRIAQANWGRLSLEERATRLSDAYHALAPAQNQLARLISLEMGKDARRATYEVAGTVTNAPYFIEEAAAALQTEQGEGRSRTQYSTGYAAGGSDPCRSRGLCELCGFFVFKMVVQGFENLVFKSK